MNIIMGLITIAILLAFGFLLSENKKAIKLRVIAMGLLVQFVMMFLVLKTSIGQIVLQKASDIVLKVLSFSGEGISFVFGGFATDFYSFAINVLAVICFTSALISVLYYLKVIPMLVKVVGRGIAKLMGSTEVETFCAVGNAFLGGTEAPLLTKPFLKDLTRSELFAVVLGGFASVSVSVVLGYSQMGIDMKYILVQMATVPFSTLLMAKLIIPETEESKTSAIEVTGTDNANLFDAIGDGAVSGLYLALNVGAVLIAFVGIMGLINYVLGFVGTNLTDIFGIILKPLAWLLNIPAEEVHAFTSSVGLKIAVNEYTAISEVGPLLVTLSERTKAILSIALVNFANFSTVGIVIAGFSSFCPEKKEVAAGFGFKALLGGILTTLISAAMIGMFF